MVPQNRNNVTSVIKLSFISHSSRLWGVVMTTPLNAGVIICNIKITDAKIGGKNVTRLPGLKYCNPLLKAPILGI